MKRPHPTILLLQWLTAAYAALQRPAWAPPAWVFAPVWTVLYALIGVAAWRISRLEGKGKGLGLWWVGLVLNALWPWLFFGFNKLGLAFGEVLLLWLTIVATIVVFSKRDRAAAWLLVPYLAWVGFAAVLNLAIWRLN